VIEEHDVLSIHIMLYPSHQYFPLLQFWETLNTMQKPLERILLVEDEEDIREITNLLLEGLGDFTVKACENGLEALGAVSEFSPDLILCDVMMPEMDGIATFNAFKKLPELRNAPFVFMSARVQKHEIEEYREMGAAGVIDKPFDPAGLPQKLFDIWSHYYV